MAGQLLKDGLATEHDGKAHQLGGNVVPMVGNVLVVENGGRSVRVGLGVTVHAGGGVRGGYKSGFGTGAAKVTSTREAKGTRIIATMQL